MSNMTASGLKLTISLKNSQLFAITILLIKPL